MTCHQAHGCNAQRSVIPLTVCSLCTTFALHQPGDEVCRAHGGEDGTSSAWTCADRKTGGTCASTGRSSPCPPTCAFSRGGAPLDGDARFGIAASGVLVPEHGSMVCGAHAGARGDAADPLEHWRIPNRRRE